MYRNHYTGNCIYCSFKFSCEALSGGAHLYDDLIFYTGTSGVLSGQCLFGIKSDNLF